MKQFGKPARIRANRPSQLLPNPRRPALADHLARNSLTYQMLENFAGTAYTTQVCTLDEAEGTSAVVDGMLLTDRPILTAGSAISVGGKPYSVRPYILLPITEPIELHGRRRLRPSIRKAAALANAGADFKANLFGPSRVQAARMAGRQEAENQIIPREAARRERGLPPPPGPRI